MKKIFVLFFAVALCQTASAQLPVMGNHMKMSDVIAYYKTHVQPYRNTMGEPERKRHGLGVAKFPEKLENNDYQFNRWKWYWQQHLDGNGYLVSPVKTFNSWKAYQDG